MQYEKIKFPDGQISVKNLKYNSYIKERINSYEDLFFVKSLASTLLNRNKYLFIPCLFGQRSDRKFNENQSFDLKIITDFINSCKFDKVEIFDPHSDVSLALIDNSIKLTSKPFVADSITNLIDTKNTKIDELVLVSPDAGAYKKVFEYGKELNLPVVAANKHRDLDGTIQLKFVGDVKDKECLIVDDLCDGGYTFYLLAKALREQGASKVYLYVSHGYFSKNFLTPLEKTDEKSSLYKSIDHIYCTNSVQDLRGYEWSTYGSLNISEFVTQYKVI